MKIQNVPKRRKFISNILLDVYNNICFLKLTLNYELFFNLFSLQVEKIDLRLIITDSDIMSII